MKWLALITNCNFWKHFSIKASKKVRWWTTKLKKYLNLLSNLKKMKLNFERIVDNPLSKYSISKRFLECIGYIPRYLPNLPFQLQVKVGASTPDQNIQCSNPIYVLDRVFELNRITRVFLTFSIKYDTVQWLTSIKQGWLLVSVVAQHWLWTNK